MLRGGCHLDGRRVRELCAYRLANARNVAYGSTGFRLNGELRGGGNGKVWNVRVARRLVENYFYTESITVGFRTE